MGKNFPQNNGAIIFVAPAMSFLSRVSTVKQRYSENSLGDFRV